MSTELSKGRSVAHSRAARVLIATNEGNAETFASALQRTGHESVCCDSPETACAAIAEQRPDLVLVDSAMAEEVASICSDLGVPFGLLGTDGPSNFADSLGTFPHSVAGEAGVALVDVLLDREELRRQMRELQALVDGMRDGSALVGRSALMRRLQTTLSRAAEGDATVLIEGARGSGKSMAARVIHCKSKRGNKPIVSHTGAELDAETLQRSITEAKGTTLLIEDIEQMPSAAQQVLVRFLKERGSRPVTDGAPARIIATTSAHLPELVARGAFREDLYYRLHSYPIVVPALRERTEDIVLLAESILDQLSVSMGQRPAGFTPSGRTMLESMPWPGNVAQLENVVRRAFLVAGGAAIDERHLTLPAMATPAVAHVAAGGTAAVAVEDAESEVDEDSIRPFEEEEQQLLSRALRATRGNVRRAAQLLGIGRATLYRKIQQFNLRLQ